MTVKNLWWIVAVLALVVLAVFGTRYRNYLATPEVIETAKLEQPCDLRATPCRANFSNSQMVTFDINPKPIQPLQSLQISAVFDTQTSSPAKINHIEVNLVGVNMDMGYNIVKLEQQAIHSFRGTGMLSFCTLSRMDWEAMVFIHTETGIIKAVFPFYTINKDNS